MTAPESNAPQRSITESAQDVLAEGWPYSPPEPTVMTLAREVLRLREQMHTATAAWDARQAAIVGVVGLATKVYDPAAMPALDRDLWAAVVALLASPNDVTAQPW